MPCGASGTPIAVCIADASTISSSVMCSWRSATTDTPRPLRSSVPTLRRSSQPSFDRHDVRDRPRADTAKLAAVDLDGASVGRFDGSRQCSFAERARTGSHTGAGQLEAAECSSRIRRTSSIV